ncbi:perlucin-like protein [Saccostrea echinata]|uniref:perlucin-like protein n=1 Tax=Saccostrea echinata TaxID=191078 RepID=UPI002A81A283|nr:perlucin-like protein [Saccostrea echinata]
MTMNKCALLGLFPCLFLIQGIESIEVCPDGFTKHQGSCYKFLHHHLSWPESITFCKVIGAHLVTIETEIEHNFLIQKIHEIEGSFDVKDFWIDLNDAADRGTWMWSRTHTQATYLKWGGGNPNYFAREDCGGLYHGGQYFFGDFVCDRKQHLICEINLNFGETIIG